MNSLENYHSYKDEERKLSGGVKMIPIETPSGTFNVWTKLIGNNPDATVLILHGGPGATHELYTAFDSWFPAAGIAYCYYDQLGSYYSDKPDDDSLWTLERFVEEVEQVRLDLGLDKSNFILYGQSWGGLLALEYALKYQQNLKGLIISNMMASVPEYGDYVRNVLAPKLPDHVWKDLNEIEESGDFSNPRYMDLLMEYYYPQHLLRMPQEKWPEPVNRTFGHLNERIYTLMQGPSEFGIGGDVLLKDWDRKDELKDIHVPTLTIGGTYDTMDPEHMKWMATQFPQGKNLNTNGSHLSIYDDQKNYFEGIIDFITGLDT
jgi:proline iminopeptidase